MGRLDRLTARSPHSREGTPAASEQAWLTCGATVVGAAHTRRGLPNQDAFRCISAPGRQVAAVADGHGADEYVRSAAGARFAADLLVEQLSDVGPPSNDGELGDRLRALAAAFVARWREAVLADVGRTPFVAQERAALCGDDGSADAAVRAYGTTALGVCLAGEWVGAVAIGDGDLGYVDANGTGRPLCARPESIGVSTDSLASVDALDAVRVDVTPAADVIAVWLCSDGFSTAQADPGWRQLVARQLHEQVTEHGAADIAARLPDWLEPAAAVGDDTTMALLLRTRAAWAHAHRQHGVVPGQRRPAARTLE